MAKFIYATSYLKHVNIRCDKRPSDAKAITLEEVANFNVISQRKTLEDKSESVRDIKQEPLDVSQSSIPELEDYQDDSSMVYVRKRKLEDSLISRRSSCCRSPSENSDKYIGRCGISDTTNVNGNISSSKVKMELSRSHRKKKNLESIDYSCSNNASSSLISRQRIGSDRLSVNTFNNSTTHFFIEGSDGARICVNGFVLAMYSKIIKDEIEQGSSSITVDNDVLNSIKIAMKVLLRCEKKGTIEQITIANLCHVLRAATALDIPALFSLGLSFSEKELMAFPDKISPQFVTEFVKIQSYLGNDGRKCLHRVLQAVVTRGRSALIKDGFHKLSNGLSVALFEALGKNNIVDMDLLF